MKPDGPGARTDESSQPRQSNVREKLRRCKNAVTIDEHSVITRLYYYIYRGQGSLPAPAVSFWGSGTYRRLQACRPCL